MQEEKETVKAGQAEEGTSCQELLNTIWYA